MRSGRSSVFLILFATILGWANLTPAPAAERQPPDLLTADVIPPPPAASLRSPGLRIGGYFLTTIGSELAISGLALGFIGMGRDSRAVTVGGWATLTLGAMMIIPGFALLVEGRPWGPKSRGATF